MTNMPNEPKSYTFFQNASSDAFEKARALRKNGTKAEDKLWQAVRNRKIDGLKFRRQHPFYIYIFDFYCHKAKLAIEIDGGYHDLPKQKTLDIERTDRIREMGISELRFTNENVINQFDMVCESIINSCNNIIAKDR